MQPSLGDRIRSKRLGEGLTLKEVAEKLGVTPPTIFNWETGRIVPNSKKISQLEKIVGPITNTPDNGANVEREVRVSSYGVWLRREREAKGLSVPELGNKSSVTPATIYNIEAGRISNPQAATRDRLEVALQEKAPVEVVNDTENTAQVAGLGALTDFNPNVETEWPNCAGVYVLYDVSQRPVYIGRSRNIAERLAKHYPLFWYKRPIVEYASYIEVPDKKLRAQLEQAMIKFLKSNAVINKQSIQSFDDD